MIEKQRLRITTCAALFYHCAQSFQKIVTIVFVSEKVAFFDSSGNHTVQGTGSINAGFLRHALLVSNVR
jgi:hypothetical protein